MLFLRTCVLALLLSACISTVSGMQQHPAPDAADRQIERMVQLLAQNEMLALVFFAQIQRHEGLRNIRDERGATILHIFAEMGWARGIELWITSHSDQIRATDHAGLTPQAYAQRENYQEAARLLEPR